MTRRRFRISLAALLALAVLFAVWGWFRPYEWRPDPKARCEVRGVEVRRDHGYCWVNAHVVMRPGERHDLMKPVWLEISGGPEERHEPADTTLGGREGEGTTEIWFRFWIEEKELAHPLVLYVNDGALVLKANSGVPNLGTAGTKHFVTNRW